MRKRIALIIMAVVVCVLTNTSFVQEAKASGDIVSCIIYQKDTLLYSLPNGGVDFPYERNYYKLYDGEALFASYDEKNTSDFSGYDWYSCLLVSRDKAASLYYTTPTEWMGGYGETYSINYHGETWYYTSGAAMHLNKEDEPKDVFHINDVTGVAVYNSAKEAAIDVLDCYFGNETNADEVVSNAETNFVDIGVADSIPEVIEPDNTDFDVTHRVDVPNTTYVCDFDDCVSGQSGALLYTVKSNKDSLIEYNYYKESDKYALVAIYQQKNTDINSGSDLCGCLMVSKDKNATRYYVTPVEGVCGYVETDYVEFDGAIWYYSYGAALPVNEINMPENVLNINQEYGVAVYDNAREAAIDFLNYYLK